MGHPLTSHQIALQNKSVSCAKEREKRDCAIRLLNISSRCVAQDEAVEPVSLLGFRCTFSLLQLQVTLLLAVLPVIWQVRAAVSFVAHFVRAFRPSE